MSGAFSRDLEEDCAKDRRNVAAKAPRLMAQRTIPDFGRKVLESDDRVHTEKGSTLSRTLNVSC